MKLIIIIGLFFSFISEGQATYPKYKLEDIMSQGNGEMELVKLNLGPIQWDEIQSDIEFNYKYADPSSVIFEENLLKFHFNLIHVYRYNIPYENGDIINFADHTDPYPVFVLNYDSVYEDYYNEEQNCSVRVSVERYSVVVKIEPTLGEQAKMRDWTSDNSHVGFRYTLDQVKRCALLAKPHMQKDLEIFVVRSKNLITPRPEDFN